MPKRRHRPRLRLSGELGRRRCSGPRPRLTPSSSPRRRRRPSWLRLRPISMLRRAKLAKADAKQHTWEEEEKADTTIQQAADHDKNAEDEEDWHTDKLARKSKLDKPLHCNPQTGTGMSFCFLFSLSLFCCSACSCCAQLIVAAPPPTTHPPPEPHKPSQR
jgi:hypothetical protein